MWNVEWAEASDKCERESLLQSPNALCFQHQFRRNHFSKVLLLWAGDRAVATWYKFVFVRSSHARTHARTHIFTILSVDVPECWSGCIQRRNEKSCWRRRVRAFGKTIKSQTNMCFWCHLPHRSNAKKEKWEMLLMNLYLRTSATGKQIVTWSSRVLISSTFVVRGFVWAMCGVRSCDYFCQ